MLFFRFLIHIMYYQIFMHMVYHYFRIIYKQININYQILLIYQNLLLQILIFNMVLYHFDFLNQYRQFYLEYFIFPYLLIILLLMIYHLIFIGLLIYYQDFKMILFFEIFMTIIVIIFSFSFTINSFQNNLYHLNLQIHRLHSHHNNNLFRSEY